MAMKAAHKMKVDPHSGRMVSAKSKTGDPACSAATSAWVLGRKAGNVAASVYAVLAKCRAMARQNRKAELAHHAGKLAAGRGTWQRSEQARAKVAERHKQIMDPNSERNNRQSAAHFERARQSTAAKSAATRAVVKEWATEQGVSYSQALENQRRLGLAGGGRKASVIAAERAGKRAAQQQARPSLREQAAAHRANRGSPVDRLTMVQNRINLAVRRAGKGQKKAAERAILEARGAKVSAAKNVAGEEAYQRSQAHHEAESAKLAWRNTTGLTVKDTRDNTTWKTTGERHSSGGYWGPLLRNDRGQERVITPAHQHHIVPVVTTTPPAVKPAAPVAVGRGTPERVIEAHKLRQQHAARTLTPLHREIEAAYLKHSKGQENVRVRIADIRESLPHVPRATLDRALLDLERRDLSANYPLDNPLEHTARDKAAVLKTPSGDERHIVYMSRLPKVPAPKPPPPAAKPAAPVAALPPRTADTMSEAIAGSSPSGRMSKRFKRASDERLRVALFGKEGLQRQPEPPPTHAEHAESLRRTATELRGLAERGMKPIAHRKEADRLEAEAAALTAAPKPPPPAVHADVAATVARAKAATLREQAEAHRASKGLSDPEIRKARAATLHSWWSASAPTRGLGVSDTSRQQRSSATISALEGKHLATIQKARQEAESRAERFRAKREAPTLALGQHGPKLTAREYDVQGRATGQTKVVPSREEKRYFQYTSSGSGIEHIARKSQWSEQDIKVLKAHITSREAAGRHHEVAELKTQVHEYERISKAKPFETPKLPRGRKAVKPDVAATVARAKAAVERATPQVRTLTTKKGVKVETPYTDVQAQVLLRRIAGKPRSKFSTTPPTFADELAEKSRRGNLSPDQMTWVHKLAIQHFGHEGFTKGTEFRMKRAAQHRWDRKTKQSGSTKWQSP
jgi:hypothetical protein